MPVWLEPRGSRKAKLTAFVAYLRAMQARCECHAANTDDAATRLCAQARAETYDLVAQQLGGLI